MPDAKFFLDTNIIIYSIDTVAETKKIAISGELVERALKGKGYISTQVAQECLSLLTSSKVMHLMAAADVRDYLSTTLEPLIRPLPMVSLYRHALSIQDRWRFGFYDALIIAGALALDCDRLYSEDFQHGQCIEGLTIIDPFIES